MKRVRLLRRHRAAPSQAERRPPPPPTPVRGCLLLLRRLDRDLEGAPILDALAERYELTSLGDEGRTFRVVVDDAINPKEAIVRLVVALDEIDRRWERCFAWPRSE